LRRSRLKEIDQAAIAFNAMVRTLRVFAVYVPRQIVQGLISRGVTASLVSENREVTVLFTDIVGFTARTEMLSAEQTAAFLNHHFGLLTGCIEAEDGMVDKFIGDALMALWNAIEEQDDHALRAVRAATRIVAAVRRDNAGRDVPVRMRIGLHSGRVVVGNIGSSSRMNYTVVGDTVNAAQRLEVLAQELLPQQDIAVVLSETTAAALPAGLPVRPLGRHRLRGRDEPLDLFALVV
jgi:class 3 adenylate cyclase